MLREKKKSRESADLTRASSRIFRFAHRSFYLYFQLSPLPNLPSSSGYIESNISPSVFEGYIPALSSILSCRQLQTRRPITVSDEGAAGTQEAPFFGITCEYLDLILFAWKLRLPHE